MSSSDELLESRLILEESRGPMQRLSSSDLLEASEYEAPYNPDYPHRRNGFKHSKRVMQVFAQRSVIQKEFDRVASITIADPMDYMATYADEVIRWKKI